VGKAGHNWRIHCGNTAFCEASCRFQLVLPGRDSIWLRGKVTGWQWLAKRDVIRVAVQSTLRR
jgi:hypothetical protein